MTAARYARLSPVQRDELNRRLKAGEKAASLAAEFGVSRSAVSQMKRRAGGGSRAVTSSGAGVAVRLSPAELDALDRLKMGAGYESNSEAIRALLRMSVGLLEFTRTEEERLAEVQTELHKIGVNINQLALAANRGRTDLVQAQWADLKDLQRALPELRSYLKAVVDEQRRKGVRLFEKFAEASRV